MSTIIRILYVAILACSYGVAVYLMQAHELLFITLLIFGMISILLSCVPIQIEFHKRREPAVLPISMLSLPVLLYYWGTGSLDLWTPHFIQFFAMFLYLVNVGGFLLGMMVSPLMARHRGNRDPRIERKENVGKNEIKNSGFIPFMIFLLVGTLVTLYFAALTVVAQSQSFSNVQQVFVVVVVLGATYIVVRLTFRSSIWGDPQKYSFYDPQIMRDYFNLVRRAEDQPPNQTEKKEGNSKNPLFKD